MKFFDTFILYFLIMDIFFVFGGCLWVFVNFFNINLFNFLGMNTYIGIFSIFLFYFILVSCFGGFFRYSFCLMGYFKFTFIFCFLSWLVRFLHFTSLYNYLVYLSKWGDPFSKRFFLIFIEVIRDLSRPVSLTVRLTVNVYVGHMLGVLLLYMYELSSFFFFVPMLSIFVESFVFFIQRYIFSRLVYLYISD